jgi:hypothetical protein
MKKELLNILPMSTYSIWCSYPEYPSTFYAKTRGQAKMEYYREYGDCGIDYLDIRCQILQKGIRIPHENAKRIQEVASKRELPFVFAGMRVKCGKNYGTLVNGNDSQNFDILFDNGENSNCHPTWDMVYYDRKGNVLAEYKGTLK